ncbi:autotransporter-associated beta strand repeat-containing protein [Coraliomargarita sp. W4R72]
MNFRADKPKGLLTLCALVATAGSLNAVTYEWNAGTAAFDADPANWTNVANGNPATSVPDNDVIRINNGGTVTISDSDSWLLVRGEIGFDSGDVGTLEMSGDDLTTTLNTTSEMQIGRSGTGTFNLSGGTVNVNNHFYLAINLGSEGNFNQSGGIVNVVAGKQARFGWRGDGTMNMTGGEFNADVVTLGPRGSGQAVGVGIVTQSNGEINAGVFFVGDSFDTARTESGVYNLSGNGVLNAGDFIVGRDGGNGRAEMTGGTINASNFLAIGHNDGANGILNQSGGTVNMTSGTSYIARWAAGDAVTGAWTMSGTAVANLDDVVLSQSTSAGTLTLNGGTLTATQIRSEVSGGGTSILNLNGGKIVANADNATFLEGLTEANVKAGGATFDTDGNDITIAQDLLDDGAGDVIKAGTGELTFSGDNTYLGDTVVQAGSLILADGGSMTFAIGAAGSNNMITGTGTVDLSGLLIFDFENLASSTPNSWTIVDSALTASYGETFSILSFTEAEAGIWTYDAANLTYTFSESTGILSAVPEPAQFALLMGFLVVGASVMRRKPRAIV